MSHEFKPWCTGKQLPLGFNSLVASMLATSTKQQAASFKQQASSCKQQALDRYRAA
tara:strand:- start:549 stop:716 length:168 start_codon:yes stop_codon:yes gene_type:complete